MGLVAYIDEGRASEQRRTPRRTLRLQVGVVSDAAAPAQMMIHDLSPTGLLVETDHGPPVGEKLQIELPGTGSFPAKVMWSSGRFVGCKFDQPLPQAAISAALLKGMEPRDQCTVERAEPRPVQELQARIQRLVVDREDLRPGADVESAPVGEDDRLPLQTRARIMLGLGVAGAGFWAVVLWAVGVI